MREGFQDLLIPVLYSCQSSPAFLRTTAAETKTIRSSTDCCCCGLVVAAAAAGASALAAAAEAAAACQAAAGANRGSTPG